MVKSIQHFTEISINKFEELEDIFFKHPENIADYVTEITKELHTVGLLMIKESLEQMNELLKQSGKRQSSWVIEKDSKKQLIERCPAIGKEHTAFGREPGLYSVKLECCKSAAAA